VGRWRADWLERAGDLGRRTTIVALKLIANRGDDESKKRDSERSSCQPHDNPAQTKQNYHMKTFVATMAMIVVASAGAAEKEIHANVASRMTGTWSCVTATINGKPLSDSAVKKLHLTMTGTRYKTERNDEVLFDSTYLLDTTKAPMHINMVGTEGDLIGKEAQGIVAVEGDTLKVCYTMPGKPRPTSFASATNSEAYLIIWKREKK
jgi:uncharacterized protein (TIGR03067 family)